MPTNHKVPANHEPDAAELQPQIRQAAAELGLGEASYELIVVGNNIVFRNPKD